jgi:hypothetical protein
MRASRSTKTVDWTVSAEATTGHLARLEGKYFFVQFYKADGRLASAFHPNQGQLTAILNMLGAP